VSRPPELYVPADPPPPDDEGAAAWPPEIYVPGPAPSADELSRRVRALPGGEAGDPGSPEAVERRVYGLLRDPELLDSVLERLDAELVDRDASLVVGVGRRGALLAAPLADRTGVPLLVFEDGELLGEARVPPGPALLVGDFLEPGGPLTGAAHRLEAAGAGVAGIAVLAARADTPVRIDDYNVFVLCTLGYIT